MAQHRIPVGMKPGRRECNGASLLISLSEVVPEKMRPGTRELSGLSVPPTMRNQRLATMLMNFVCQEADANGIVLILLVKPFGDVTEGGPVGPPLDEPALIKWYERFGFNVLQDTAEGAFMARRPHVKQRPNLVLVNAVNQSLARH